ncbi:MAG: cytochrome P450 [Burkholderiaceae bacterium]|nr:cytochrome P450 [Burkholderiaceae bacterium]
MVQDVLAPGPQERFDLDANDESLPLLQESKLRYGDICRVMTQTRASDSVVIHDPDDIRHVLLTNRGNYVKGVGLERVRVLLGNGLIVNDGESWARQRRMMQPIFHSQVIRGFSTFMERLNLELIERWAGHAERGKPINLTRELSEVTLSIVLRALFSADLDRLIASEGSSPFDLLTRETRRDLPFAAKFRALTRHVLAMIDARRKEQRIEMDLLSMLMEARDKDSGEAMPDRALLDEIMTLIVAGHETTASTLNWTWYLLSQHPEVEARLHESIAAATPTAAPMATPSDAPPEANSYVERVLQEAMRLYPPGWLFTRRALKDDRLGGYHVPAGTDIFICPYLLHRHAKHWDRPDDFDPQRFEPAVAESRHRFAFLPFSAGPRYCIGASFAMAEMTMHMNMVAQRFRLRYACDESPRAEFQINLRTRQDVDMHVVAR